MTIDKKTIVIIILSVALVIVGYIAFKPAPVNINEKFIKEELTRERHLKDSIMKHASGVELANEILVKQNDSLKSLEPKIKDHYDKKYKDIDRSSANSISSEFENIFANSNIR